MTRSESSRPPDGWGKEPPTHPPVRLPGPEDLDEEGGAPDWWQYPSDPERGLLRTQVDLAAALDVSRRTVGEWVARPDFPKRYPCGRWDVISVKRWLETREPQRGPWRYRRPK